MRKFNGQKKRYGTSASERRQRRRGKARITKAEVTIPSIVNLKQDESSQKESFEFLTQHEFSQTESGIEEPTDDIEESKMPDPESNSKKRKRRQVIQESSDDDDDISHESSLEEEFKVNRQSIALSQPLAAARTRMVGNDRVSKLVSRADRKMESLTQREVQSSPSIDESQENESDEEEDFELSPALLSPFDPQQNGITVNDKAAMNDADDDATRLSRRRRTSRSQSTKNEREGEDVDDLGCKEHSESDSLEEDSSDDYYPSQTIPIRKKPSTKKVTKGGIGQSQLMNSVRRNPSRSSKNKADGPIVSPFPTSTRKGKQRSSRGFFSSDASNDTNDNDNIVEAEESHISALVSTLSSLKPSSTASKVNSLFQDMMEAMKDSNEKMDETVLEIITKTDCFKDRHFSSVIDLVEQCVTFFLGKQTSARDIYSLYNNSFQLSPKASIIAANCEVFEQVFGLLAALSNADCRNEEQAMTLLGYLHAVPDQKIMEYFSKSPPKVLDRLYNHVADLAIALPSLHSYPWIELSLAFIFKIRFQFLSLIDSQSSKNSEEAIQIIRSIFDAIPSECLESIEVTDPILPKKFLKMLGHQSNSVKETNFTTWSRELVLDMQSKDITSVVPTGVYVSTKDEKVTMKDALKLHAVEYIDFNRNAITFYSDGGMGLSQKAELDTTLEQLYSGRHYIVITFEDLMMNVCSMSETSCNLSIPITARTAKENNLFQVLRSQIRHKKELELTTIEVYLKREDVALVKDIFRSRNIDIGCDETFFESSDESTTISGEYRQSKRVANIEYNTKFVGRIKYDQLHDTEEFVIDKITAHHEDHASPSRSFSYSSDDKENEYFAPSGYSCGEQTKETSKYAESSRASKDKSLTQAAFHDANQQCSEVRKITPAKVHSVSTPSLDKCVEDSYGNNDLANVFSVYQANDQSSAKELLQNEKACKLATQYRETLQILQKNAALMMDITKEMRDIGCNLRSDLSQYDPSHSASFENYTQEMSTLDKNQQEYNQVITKLLLSQFGAGQKSRDASMSAR